MYKYIFMYKNDMVKWMFFMVVQALFLGSCTGHTIHAHEESKRHVLPDGSVVLLNSNSQISYVINEEVREVKLKGEAFFKVEKGIVPFVVRTPYGQVKVLGTAFNVNSNNEELEVEVDEGEVEVQANDEKKKVRGGERVLYSEAKRLFKKGKAEFKHHIWTDEFKSDMRGLGKEVEKGGKKLGKELKKLGKKIENGLD